MCWAHKVDLYPSIFYIYYQDLLLCLTFFTNKMEVIPVPSTRLKKKNRKQLMF